MGKILNTFILAVFLMGLVYADMRGVDFSNFANENQLAYYNSPTTTTGVVGSEVLGQGANIRFRGTTVLSLALLNGYTPTLTSGGLADEIGLTNGIDQWIAVYDTSGSDTFYYGGDGTGGMKVVGYNGNVTINMYAKLNEQSGACDLSQNHTICSNASGTYIIG